MKKVNLFYGDYEVVKNAIPVHPYFEFELQYEKCDNELNRFLWESRKEMTEHKNRYSGAVIIDLSKWNHVTEKPFFTSFQYFLLDNIKDLTFILDDKPSEMLLNSLKKRFSLTVKEYHLTKDTAPIHRIGFYYKEDKDNVRS